jgi:hypothetical protein
MFLGNFVKKLFNKKEKEKLKKKKAKIVIKQEDAKEIVKSGKLVFKYNILFIFKDDFEIFTYEDFPSGNLIEDYIDALCARTV